MDRTKRQITKIAREASTFLLQESRAEGVGSAEYDFLHLVRHNPGITQAEIRKKLNIDKGAAARRTANLIAKGYLRQEKNPKDGRSSFLFATEKAERLKHSKAGLEAGFYEWLLLNLEEGERDAFCRILGGLYERSKKESRAGFPNLRAFMAEKGGEV